MNTIAIPIFFLLIFTNQALGSDIQTKSTVNCYLPPSEVWEDYDIESGDISSEEFLKTLNNYSSQSISGSLSRVEESDDGCDLQNAQLPAPKNKKKKKKKSLGTRIWSWIK